MASLEARASIAQTALFERYDLLTALWEKAEQEVTARHVPYDIYRVYAAPSGQDDGDVTVMGLGVIRKNGKWRLCHGEWYYNDEPRPDDWTPIVDCAAVIRVNATKGWPKLREEVVLTSERFVPLVDKAIAFMREQTGVEAEEALMKMLAERAQLNGRHKK